MGRPLASFLSAFLAGDPAARKLLPRDFRDPAARAARVAEARTQVVSPVLLAELRAQDAAWPPSAARAAHLDALARPGTVAVITGQQVGLFLGPLYTFYKAASAIAVARQLERETGARAVPIFWLQTEDHDFEEIAACHVLGHGGAPRSFTVAADPTATARTSIAHRCLGPDVEGELAALDDALGMAPGASDVMALLRAHYRPGVSLARAFGAVIAALFAEDGLVVFDPRVPAVARLAAPLYRTAITRHEAIAAALGARKQALEDAGLAEQVPVRPSCALVFFHDGSAAGPRYRLERRERGYALAGANRQVGDAELEACLGDDPLRFSTSALLRPLVQDTLFPTAAYVGGPAELGYFAQLGPIYELYGLPQPLVVLRARFRYVDDKTRQILAKLGLRAAEVECPRAALLRRLASAVSAPAAGLVPPDALARELAGAVDPTFDRLAALLPTVDATLAAPIARTRAHVQRATTRLVEKYARALAQKDATTSTRVDRVRALLYPDDTPQERHYGWPWLAARTGVAELTQAVRAALVPFATEIGELAP